MKIVINQTDLANLVFSQYGINGEVVFEGLPAVMDKKLLASSFKKMVDWYSGNERQFTVKIAFIKAYREMTSCSLTEAKKAVETGIGC